MSLILLKYFWHIKLRQVRRAHIKSIWKQMSTCTLTMYKQHQWIHLQNTPYALRTIEVETHETETTHNIQTTPTQWNIHVDWVTHIRTTCNIRYRHCRFSSYFFSWFSSSFALSLVGLRSFFSLLTKEKHVLIDSQRLSGFEYIWKINLNEIFFPDFILFVCINSPKLLSKFP